jgi:hypothetical protein
LTSESPPPSYGIEALEATNTDLVVFCPILDASLAAD